MGGVILILPFFLSFPASLFVCSKSLFAIGIFAPFIVIGSRSLALVFWGKGYYF
jgi:hypothetical protein